MSPHETPCSVTDSPELPRADDGAPVFPEPWAAEAFALTVHLHERRVFTWGEWAASLSAEIHKPDRAADGSDYFDCWVSALCDLLVANGIAEVEDITSLQESWQRAAEATPHGKAILLENDPQR